ncbi:malic enzyme-like NAD(P)-binding protein [Shigella flexneri]
MEATPQDIIAWTEGNALVATGARLIQVVWKDKTTLSPSVTTPLFSRASAWCHRFRRVTYDR